MTENASAMNTIRRGVASEFATKVTGSKAAVAAFATTVAVLCRTWSGSQRWLPSANRYTPK